MQVEIWSDVVCPWCYIGKRRFERALETVPLPEPVEVSFRSFELNPSAERDEGFDLAARLAKKYGVSLDQARAMNQRVTDAAAGEGLAFRLDTARPGNTFDAHRLLHLAAAAGVQTQLKERLMRAYFMEGRPIGNREVLAELAIEVGVGDARVNEVLTSDEFAAEVREDERLATGLGINGVPFFVFDRRFGLSGAQPPDVMAAALQHAWSARVEAPAGS